MLRRKLPRPEGGGPLDLGDDVVLQSYKLKLEDAGDLSLRVGEGGTLTGPADTGSGKATDDTEKLSTIIEVINERFGTELDAQDLVDGVTADLVDNAGLKQAARANDKGNFAVPFKEALDDALVNRHEKHADFINKIFADAALGEFFRGWMLDKVYDELRVPPPRL